MSGAPLPVRATEHYIARPSTSEPGSWTVMEQVRGETRLRLFARARDHKAARRILESLEVRAFTVDLDLLDAACSDCGGIGHHRPRCAQVPTIGGES